MNFSKYLPRTFKGECPVCKGDLHYSDTYGVAKYYRCPNCKTLVLVFIKAQVVDEPSMGRENVDERGDNF